jgi:ribosomal protein S17E
MLLSILSFLFFVGLVTFLVLFIMKGRESLKDDLADVISAESEDDTVKKLSECMADKYESAFDGNPLKMVATISSICTSDRMTRNTLKDNKICEKYLPKLNVDDFAKQCTS